MLDEKGALSTPERRVESRPDLFANVVRGARQFIGEVLDKRDVLPVGVQEVIQRAGEGEEQPRRWSHEVEAALVQQYLVVAGGRTKRRAPSPAVESSTSRMPVAACCSSHSRA